jgi:hypothetical protein
VPDRLILGAVRAVVAEEEDSVHRVGPCDDGVSHEKYRYVPGDLAVRDLQSKKALSRASPFIFIAS